jgi:N-acetylmuramoyl-L-alanine amidase
MFVYVINAKKIIKPIRFIALLLLIALAASIALDIINIEDLSIKSSMDIGKVIIIDAGHGGEDSGAIGVNGVYEKDLNLEIALLMGEELKNRGYTVIYTRTEDKMLYLPEENIKGMRKISDLKNRCKLTEAYEDCILVSIHMNSFGSSKYSGLQVYYADGNEDSRVLATKIQNSVRKELQPENKRQVKNGKSLYLLENSSGTPIIIECGFLSNEAECKKLSQKEYQKQLSFSIICGIIEYINEIDDAV